MKANTLKLLLLTTYANFKRNKVRTFLTSLGITIGVMSVVLLNAIGLGLKNYLKEQFEGLGSNLVMIMPGNAFSDEEGIGNAFGPGLIGGVSFDEKDYNNLRKIQQADYAVPVFFKSVTLEYNGTKQLAYVEGANEHMFPVMNLVPIAGRLYTKSDLQKKSKVAVLGFVVAEKLFDSPEQSLGKTIKINSQRFKVIGVVDKKGDREMDNSAIIPYKSTFGNLNPDKTFFSIYLGVNNEDNIPEVKQKAKKILLKRYDEEEFSVTEQTEILNPINQIFGMLNGVLVAIGSISLIVGGIGIMNIMYSTVTERTKEIGIKRAIGATKNDILFQFLSESVILSIFGGFLGLTISALIVLGIRSVFPAAINLISVILAIGVSTFIGVFFGVFPARRASKLTPLEAIRYE